MTNAWDDMKKAKEDQYFMKKDKEILDKKHHELELEEFVKSFNYICLYSTKRTFYNQLFKKNQSISHKMASRLPASFKLS